MEETYFANPVLDLNVADPTIWQENNNYYLFYTGTFTGHIYTSVDMINWTDTGKCPFNSKTIRQLEELAELSKSDPHIYAPTVVKIKDTYLMYLSLTWKSMVVLIKNKNEKYFHFKDNNPYILINNSITGLNITNEDSSIAIDGNNVWLFWGSHGKLYRVQLTDDGLHLKNNKFKRVAGINCNPRRIYEGMYLYKHGEYWYLFAAKGNYTSATDPYEVVVGRSKKIDGVFRNKWFIPMTWGGMNLILKPDSTDAYLGGGHTGEIFTDKSGQDYIFYQRQRANEMHFRPLFLQRIYWDKNGWPYFENGITQMVEIKPNI